MRPQACGSPRANRSEPPRSHLPGEAAPNGPASDRAWWDRRSHRSFIIFDRYSRHTIGASIHRHGSGCQATLSHHGATAAAGPRARPAKPTQQRRISSNPHASDTTEQPYEAITGGGAFASSAPRSHRSLTASAAGGRWESRLCKARCAPTPHAAGRFDRSRNTPSREDRSPANEPRPAHGTRDYSIDQAQTPAKTARCERGTAP
jgi:hypothetical protein